MAEKQATKAPKKGAPAGAPAKGKGGASPPGATDPAPKVRAGMPRLQAFYEGTVRARLAKSFGLTNPHQVPRLTKMIGVMGSLNSTL